MRVPRRSRGQQAAASQNAQINVQSDSKDADPALGGAGKAVHERTTPSGASLSLPIDLTPGSLVHVRLDDVYLLGPDLDVPSVLKGGASGRTTSGVARNASRDSGGDEGDDGDCAGDDEGEGGEEDDARDGGVPQSPAVGEAGEEAARFMVSVEAPPMAQVEEGVGESVQEAAASGPDAGDDGPVRRRKLSKVGGALRRTLGTPKRSLAQLARRPRAAQGSAVGNMAASPATPRRGVDDEPGPASLAPQQRGGDAAAPGTAPLEDVLSPAARGVVLATQYELLWVSHATWAAAHAHAGLLRRPHPSAAGPHRATPSLAEDVEDMGDCHWAADVAWRAGLTTPTPGADSGGASALGSGGVATPLPAGPHAPGTPGASTAGPSSARGLATHTLELTPAGERVAGTGAGAGTGVGTSGLNGGAARLGRATPRPLAQQAQLAAARGAGTPLSAAAASPAALGRAPLSPAARSHDASAADLPASPWSTLQSPDAPPVPGARHAPLVAAAGGGGGAPARTALAVVSLPLRSLHRVRAHSHRGVDAGVLDLSSRVGRRVQVCVPGLMSRNRYHAFRSLRDAVTRGRGQPVEAFPRAHYAASVAVWRRTPARLGMPVSPGWRVLAWEREFARQGVGTGSRRVPGRDWRLSSANARYGMSESYPPVLAVPARVGDAELREIAGFRARGRVPALCWLHPHTGAALLRAAQPMAGLGQRRCEADERAVGEAALAASGPGHGQLVIADCRPRINAVAQKSVGGGGYEVAAHYCVPVTAVGARAQEAMQTLLQRQRGRVGYGSGAGAEGGGGGGARSPPPVGSPLGEAATTLSVDDSPSIADADVDVAAPGAGEEGEGEGPTCAVEFLGIENIHAVRRAASGWEKVCLSPNALAGDGWQNLATATRWPQYVASVLAGGRRVAEHIALRGVSVLVHCSDGWDRTAEVVSLAQLLLDPYYRTLRGFAALVEAQWCGFGHKFADRCGLSEGAPQEVAPIFVQWLDAVFQCTRQFPTRFAFNERLLLRLAQHVYSGKHGTFLYNCDRERAQARCAANTLSVWDAVLHRPHLYTNPLFEGGAEGGEKVTGAQEPGHASDATPATSRRRSLSDPGSLHHMEQAGPRRTPAGPATSLAAASATVSPDAPVRSSQHRTSLAARTRRRLSLTRPTNSDGESADEASSDGDSSTDGGEEGEEVGDGAGVERTPAAAESDPYATSVGVAYSLLRGAGAFDASPGKKASGVRLAVGPGVDGPAPLPSPSPPARRGSAVMSPRAGAPPVAAPHACVLLQPDWRAHAVVPWYRLWMRQLPTGAFAAVAREHALERALAEEQERVAQLEDAMRRQRARQAGRAQAREHAPVEKAHTGLGASPRHVVRREVGTTAERAAAVAIARASSALAALQLLHVGV